MNWHEIPPIWQTCFELAWDAQREGSNPIAALVADADGCVITTGKSAVHAELSGARSSHCEIAHAEVNALLALDNRVHDKATASSYTLFATLEPCPLCFSALYMSDVKKLAFAAKDRYGGSTNLLGTTPYLSRKPIEIDGPADHLDEISVFLNVYCDLLRGGDVPRIVHDEFAKDYPAVVHRARELAPGDALAISRLRYFKDAHAVITEAISAR